MPTTSSGPMMTMNMLGHASGGGYWSQSVSFTPPRAPTGTCAGIRVMRTKHVRILRGGLKSSPSAVTVGTPTVSAGRAFGGPRSARVDGTVRVLRSNQVGFSAFQISTTQRISPSGSRRQIVIPRPFIVTGMPSEPSIATSLRPSMYARLPSGENVTSVEVHVIRNPGIFQLDSTYSRNAGLPEIAGSPGGKMIASSVQYDRMRSMSRPLEETAAHSESRRSSSRLANVKSNLDFPWERDDRAMTE